MEVLGAVSAILPIAGSIAKSCVEMTELIRTMRNAHKDVHDVVLQSQLFSTILYEYDQTVGEGPFAQDWVKRTTEIIMKLGKRIKRGLKKLLRKVRILRRRHPASMIRRFKLRLEWYFKKSEVKQLQLSINTTMQALNVCINLVALQKAKQQLHEGSQEEKRLIARM